ncbi:hypothetical protein PHYC_01022 [Phycisphaerales bacterium]|nr:hypothetical protein PHYC_01022 [Phycisphaerales bacterium]
MHLRPILVLGLFLLTLPACAQGPQAAQPVAAPPDAGKFRVVFDPAMQDKPYSGRVYIATSQFQQPEPRRQMWNWYRPGQVFAADVKDIQPGAGVEIGADALSYPKKYVEAASGTLWVQAIARRSPDSNDPGQGEGDLCSDVVRVTFSPGNASVCELRLTKSVAAAAFQETDRAKPFSMKSERLSKFLGRDFTMHAGVVLPKGWTASSDRVYPTLYFIGGFGGTHHFARQLAAMIHSQPLSDDVLIVVPDPTCFRGHSVFADSANNGPWGAAFTEELIPAVEAAFHGAGAKAKRYVTGISSGGWSSLWLQVTYPDLFSGTWSHSPDPVDFRDFQQIDLYSPGVNMFKDEKGERRPLSRTGDRVTIWYDDFVEMETIMGPGGQIHSFEAVFGPRGRDGEPRPLFDRATGAIDPATAKAWEKYDINLVLQRKWKTLGEQLAGKLHIYAGEMDNFYLEGAVKKLKATLADLGSDAEVVIVPDMGHTIYGPGMNAMWETIAKENLSEAPR